MLWEELLVHGSMLKMTAVSNKTYYHAVPKDASQPKGTVRFSLVFRTIKSQKEQKAKLD